MALMQCPECGQNISDRAVNCPKCGYPLYEEKKVESTVAFVPPEAAAESPEVEASNIDPAAAEAMSNRVFAEGLMPERGSTAPATPIPTSPYRMKTDRNAAVILLLSVVTLGIYGIYFMATVEFLRAFSRN